MKIETIEEKIKLRANQQAQAKIEKFKQQIDAALNELLTSEDCASFRFGGYAFSETEQNKHSIHFSGARRKLQVLQLAIQDRDYSAGVDRKETKRSWPRWIWEKEEQDIRNELMEKMDLMQRLLMTKPSTTENEAIPSE